MSTGAILETTVSDAEALFEIIDGERVEMPPMSSLSAKLANRLARRLDACTWADDGEAFVEMLFHLALPVDRNRRPDVAWVSFQRWPKDRPMPDKNAWEVAPNVAAEVVSPTDLVEELMQKISEYFRAGVELVWVVYPNEQLVHVY